MRLRQRLAKLVRRPPFESRSFIAEDYCRLEAAARKVFNAIEKNQPRSFFFQGHHANRDSRSSLGRMLGVDRGMETFTGRQV